jgi:hypothetical protein
MRSRRTFSRDAHHPDSLPGQLTVVWSLPLPVGSEGPSLIPRAARLLLGDHLGLPSAPSWRTIIGKPHHNHIPVRFRFPPLFDPQIKPIVQIDVANSGLILPP